jgi:hypothetical protein
VTTRGVRATGVPSKVVIVTFSGVTSTTSPSSRKTTRRVWSRSAGMSEAMKFSPSPRPRTIGVALFAATSRSGSLSEDDDRVRAVELPIGAARRLSGARCACSSIRCE